MVNSKPPRSHEGNESKGFNNKSKGQASNTKRYRGDNIWNKNQRIELKANTDFKGRCSDLEGYVFNLVPISSDKFARMTK